MTLQPWQEVSRETTLCPASAKALALNTMKMGTQFRVARAAEEFARGAFVFVQPEQLGRLEGLQLQFDSDQPAQVAVEEKQVEMQIVLADAHALLAAVARICLP